MTSELTLAPREGYIVPVESENKGTSTGSAGNLSDITGD